MTLFPALVCLTVRVCSLESRKRESAAIRQVVLATALGATRFLLAMRSDMSFIQGVILMWNWNLGPH